MMYTPPSSGICCALCMRSDRVQKVSSVVASGTSEVSGRYRSRFSRWATRRYTNVRQSDLSKRLSPPAIPKIGRLQIILLFVLGCCIVVAAQNVSKGQSVKESINFLEITGSLLAVYIVFHIWTRVRRIPIMHRWQRLYYCYRDDVVFLPDTPGACVPASKISQLWH